MLPTLLKNFGEFYKVYFPVINHQNKTYVRKFAAESFSHILRRVKKENLANIINKHCLKPFIKPYKYIHLEKDISNTIDQPMSLDLKESFNHHSPFKQDIDKLQLNKDLDDIQFKNIAQGCTYKFSFEEKQNLITVISNLFVETIYGVQKKLYTEWKTILNVMIDNVKIDHKKSDNVCHHLLLRYTVIKLIPRLEANALHELYTYIINNLGESMISNTSQNEFSGKSRPSLNTWIMIIKDIFLFKEGYRAYPIIAVSWLGFLYKLLKARISNKIELHHDTLSILIETLYLGYYNKIDEFIKIFDLLHKDNLVSKIQKLGNTYIIQFYTLAAMNQINEKFHDLMKYEDILHSKNKITVKNYFLSKNSKRMKLIFKPLAKILFDIDDEQCFEKLLQWFVVIKHKIDIEAGDQKYELLELPTQFVEKIHKKISELYQHFKQETGVITESGVNLISDKK